MKSHPRKKAETQKNSNHLPTTRQRQKEEKPKKRMEKMKLLNLLTFFVATDIKR
jgi:hypothetical protein